MADEIPDYLGYQRLPNWVLGFHGCDESVVQDVLNSQNKHLKPSENKWDWLGNGIYFWENDPLRAMQFAQEGIDGKVTRGNIKKPCVIGAVIDLGLCLNLFDQVALQEIKWAAENLAERSIEYEQPLPKNTDKGRFLDRAVFEHLHWARNVLHEAQPEDFEMYQTVRSQFPEGGELYPGASFTEQNHIQIAVRDTSVIKGYFLPRL